MLIISDFFSYFITSAVFEKLGGRKRNKDKREEATTIAIFLFNFDRRKQ